MPGKIDGFKQLLNEISHELTDRNLQSLIHLSNIPGGIQSSVTDGHKLFTFLINDGLISSDDVGYLRKLLRKMRPRRRGLVELVDDYIKQKHNVDDVSSILGELSNSYERVHTDIDLERPEEYQQRVMFHLDCTYMYCGCRRAPPCCVFVLIVTILAVVITCILWYTNVPEVSKHINSNEDLKNAGAYLILAECMVPLFIFLGYLLWRSCLKLCHRSSLPTPEATGRNNNERDEESRVVRRDTRREPLFSSSNFSNTTNSVRASTSSMASGASSYA